MRRRWKTLGLLSLSVTLLLSACAPSVDTPPPAPTPSIAPTPTPPPDPTVSTLAFCGDSMLHLPLIKEGWDEARQDYDFSPIMQSAQKYVSKADYAVTNLETTLSGGPNYSGYPAFNSPDALAYNLKQTGFDIVLTANNHCLDRGFSGLSRTLDVLDQAGLAHVGTSRTQAEQDENIVVADVGGISVAFLGFTYGTNAIPLPKDAPYAANVYNKDYLTTLAKPDYDMLKAKVEQAKALNTDMIAVLLHWGLEYFTTQSPYQDDVADFLIANGVDLVLGGHSHVPQPITVRTVTDDQGQTHRGFVCFSLGNFFSGQNIPLTDTTAVLTLELTRDNVTGQVGVTNCEYAPMLMLDPKSSPTGRYTLVDATQAATEEGWNKSVQARAQQAIADCGKIFGSVTPAPKGELWCEIS